MEWVTEAAPPLVADVLFLARLAAIVVVGDCGEAAGGGGRLPAMASSISLVTVDDDVGGVALKSRPCCCSC